MNSLKEKFKKEYPGILKGQAEVLGGVACLSLAMPILESGVWEAEAFVATPLVFVASNLVVDGVQRVTRYGKN